MKLLAAGLLVLSATACGTRIGDRSGAPGFSFDNINLGSPIASLELLPANPVIGLTDDVQFTVNAVAFDGSRRDVTALVQWNNADLSVLASGANAGLFRALAAGASTVTATLSNHQVSGLVTVNPAQLVSLQFSPALGSLPRGVAQNYALIGVFSDGSTHDLSDQATWSSSDPSVVTASNNPGDKGLLTVVNNGTATIDVTVMGQTYSQTIVGTNPTLNAIQVHVPAGILPVGLSKQLTVTGSYSDGTSADLTLVATWESSDGDLVTANFSGVAGSFFAVGSGVATISARVNGLFSQTALTIAPAAVASLEVLPAAATIPNGTVQAFTATGHLTNGQSVDLTSSVQWSAGTGAAMSVPGNASSFRGLNAGRAPIVASYGSLSANADLTINAAALNQLAVSIAAPSVALGLDTQASAQGTFTDGSVVDLTADVTWSVSDPNWASVSNALGTKGALHGLNVGSGTITATYAGIQRSAPFTITNASLSTLDISAAAASVAKGLTTQLTATATYSDGSTADVTSQVTWASATPTLATVGNAANNKGLVSAVAVGSASFTADLGGLTSTRAVNVTAATVSALAVTSGSASVAKGLTLAFTAIATYTDGTFQDVTAQAAWSTTTAATASVGNAGATKGVMNALNSGPANIRAGFAGLSASKSVTVTAASLTGLAINAAATSLAKGTDLPLTATATYSDGTSADVTATADWAGATPAFGQVGNASANKGLFTALNPGAASVTATLDGQQATRAITVTAAAITTLSLSPAAATVSKGLSTQVNALATYSDGSTADVTAQATWTSASPSFASVSDASGSKGLVNALAAGTAQFTASYGGLQANGTVTVTAATLTALAINPAANTLSKGLSLQLNATATYTDGSTADVTAQASWASSASSLASIGDASGTKGLVQALASGSTAITASLNGQQATKNLTVTAASISALTLASAANSVAKGLSLQITATATYSDGSTADVTSQATWTSAASSLASVSDAAGSKGLVNGLAVGSAAINAGFGGLSAGKTVNVTAATLTSLSLGTGTGSLAKGTASQLTATATYTDGSAADVTSQATWSSSAATLASVGNSTGTKGLVNGLNLGNATINASFGGQSASKVMTVTAANVTALSVSAGTTSLAKGLSTQLTATATYSDGSTADVTAQANWTSAQATIATVSDVAGTKGAVSSLALGDATLTATLAGFSASKTVTITAATITSIAVNPSSITVLLGASRSLAAIATYTDGTTADVTNAATWTSSSSAILSVTNIGTKGKVTTITLGNGTITATLGGKSGQCAVISALSL